MKPETLSTTKILEQALKLGSQDRMKIVQILIESLDLPEPNVDQPWIDAAIRRFASERD